jgi:uncharacterized membrane protein YphA (DoxX/SURF4 family)
MFDTLHPWMHILGRVMFGLAFVVLTIGHFTNTPAMVGYAASRGVPAPKITVLLTGVMGLVGGITVMLGQNRFIGGGLIFLFMVLTSTLVHHFWTEKDPMARMNEMIHFWKDIALGGAALFMAYYAGWTWPMSLGG